MLKPDMLSVEVSTTYCSTGAQSTPKEGPLVPEYLT